MLVKRMFRQATIRNPDRRLPPARDRVGCASRSRVVPNSVGLESNVRHFHGTATMACQVVQRFAIRMAPFRYSRFVGASPTIYRRAMTLPPQPVTRIEAAAGPVSTVRPALP
jgi:hypothetical protein